MLNSHRNVKQRIPKKIHYSVKQKANKVVYLIKMLKILGNEGQNSKKITESSSIKNNLPDKRL